MTFIATSIMLFSLKGRSFYAFYLFYKLILGLAFIHARTSPACICLGSGIESIEVWHHTSAVKVEWISRFLKLLGFSQIFTHAYYSTV